jgi:ribulose-5-phosphate 4-epimerase/fuculose-1-phosphate aldolase
LTQHAGEVRDLLCYHKYGVADDNPEECDKLGKDLANKWLMIMHNHGLLSAGRTVAEAFYFLYVLEIACKVQVDVMATKAELIYPDQDAMDVLARYNLPDIGQPNDAVTRSWSALIRMLDNQDPTYKT